MAEAEQLATIREHLEEAELGVMIYGHREPTCLVLHCMFGLGDAYARLYVHSGADGVPHSVLYPQRYGSGRTFKIDQERLLEMGAYISVPVETVAAQVRQWVRVSAAWNEQRIRLQSGP